MDDKQILQKYTQFKEFLRCNNGYCPNTFTFEFFKNKFIKYTQEAKVYWHLCVYGSITARECTYIYRIQYPSKRIERLRKRGINIVNIEKKGFNWFGDYCNYVEYTLKRNEEECA